MSYELDTVTVEDSFSVGLPEVDLDVVSIQSEVAASQVSAIFTRSLGRVAAQVGSGSRCGDPNGAVTAFDSSASVMRA